MLLRVLFTVAFLAALLPGADLEQQAAEVLETNCWTCHGAALQMSGLDLRSRDEILGGGERGPAAVAGYPEKSFLYLFASHEQKPHMPPGKKLSGEELEILRRWIRAGIPLGEPSQEEAGRLEALRKLEERPITEEERQYWSFQPPEKAPVPEVRDARWSFNPVDAFLYARMQEEGVTPNPPAGRRTLVRRAYLDLTGLPPTPEQVNAFLEDDSPDAFVKLVDRLLESPHYGERWARYWMDLVRYADSGGFERDFDWPTMYRYRDYIIGAFNQDKPYDRFIREQLAGDEFWPRSDAAHVATGFLRLGPENNIKDERTRMDELDDILSTTSLTFLGMTVGCARCHDHKFDPIAQKDYYRMQAVFFSTVGRDHPLVSEEVVARHEAANKKIDEQKKRVEEEKKQLEKPYHDELFEAEIDKLPEYLQKAWRTPPAERTEGQRLNARQIEATLEIPEEDIVAIMSAGDKAKHGALIEELSQLEKQRPDPYPTARTITEESRQPLPSYFLHRGSPGAKGTQMKPGVLSVTHRGEWEFPEPPPRADTSWRRRAFAEWVASPQNPLTARVMVNRIWQHHFGEGIVRTPSNFGATGEAPTHPELLDWLAVEFMRRGWSLKSMHRLIMNSRAYKMSSRDDPKKIKMDPQNRLLWRQGRRRLQAEVLRDQILAAAGTLDRSVGGPSIFPYIDPSLFQSSTGRTWPSTPDRDPETWRRSIYVFSKRSIRYPLFEAFDQPDMINSCQRRNRSTTAPQALLLMNNDFVRLQAKFFAQRLQLEAGPDLEDQIRRAFELALVRQPTRTELAEAKEFITGDPYGIVHFCHALFNLNEFVYLQ